MPRSPRIDFPGLPQHLIVRGNNHGDIFFRDGDRLVFLKYLAEACARDDCEVHAFVLMTNHVHLLATGNGSMSLSRMMQDVGRRYVKYVNTAYKRSGALYEGRFKSSLVESSSYFLTCMRYIELNPVRAGMTPSPAEYPWSSFAQNASGEPGGLVSAHPEYVALGADPARRAMIYVKLFEEAITDRHLAAIRESGRMGRALGSDRFCAAVEATLRRPVKVVRRSRPARRR